jgi:hypothetical protein
MLTHTFRFFSSFSYPITQGGVVHIFHHVMINIRQLFLPTDRLPDVTFFGNGVGANMVTTANAAGTNGIMSLLKHGGARDNILLVTHPMTDLFERCLTFAIARQAH